MKVKLGNQLKHIKEKADVMNMQYLVYDIESVVDKSLLNKVMYQGQGLSDQEAYLKHVESIKKEDGSFFVNPAYHIPVCLCVLAIDKKFEIQKIGLLAEEEKTPAAIVKHFWDIYNNNSVVPVDFNGRGYDIRLMELWAYRLGLRIHGKHFVKFGTRYRFSDEKHLDLHEVLTNNLAIRYQGGLNYFAKVLNKPGKMDTKGDMVQELFENGDLTRIEDYCFGDVMDTYYVFLRWMVVKGEITLDQEKDLVDKSVEKMRDFSNKTGYLKKYLDLFAYWEPSF